MSEAVDLWHHAAPDTRLKRIAEQHTQCVQASSGITSGYCLECDHIWPCPTYRWAVDPTVGTFCTWDLGDCEIEEHDHHDLLRADG